MPSAISRRHACVQRWLGEPMFLRCSGSPADGSVEAINTVNFGMALDLLCLPVSRSPSGRLDLHPQIVIEEDAVPFKLFAQGLAATARQPGSFAFLDQAREQRKTPPRVEA